MKRIFSILSALLLLLTGCGQVTELPAAQPEQAFTEDTGTSAVPPDAQVQAHCSEFPDFYSITDDEAIKRLQNGMRNDEVIADYTVPPAGSDFRVELVPDGMTAEAYFAQLFPDTAIPEDTGDSLAAVYPTGDEKIVMPRHFRLSGNGYAYYDGGLDAESVLQNFDLLMNGQRMLYRRYQDDPEIKCIAYDFYAVSDNGDGTATLGWYSCLIDREDHLVNTIPEWNCTHIIELPDAPALSSQDAPAEKIITDIELTLEKREILIGHDDPTITVRAVPDAAYTPALIFLVDADTGETVCELYDDNDYNAHGDSIQGDGWYCNRYPVDTDFGTDPDVSEDKYFRFYAQFEESGVIHRSETCELWVTEPFTDAELEIMEQVDNAVSALLDSPEWKKADSRERRELAISLLSELSDRGYIRFDPEDARSEAYDAISYEYAAGGLGAIGLEDFRSDRN